MATQTTNAASNIANRIPTTMRAVVYRGVNDMRVETVAVPEIGPGELLDQSGHLRHLRHGSQEDPHRLAFGAPHLRP